MLKKVMVESAAEAYLELLAARGVEYFFGNAGTDFAPLIEAYAKRAAQGQHLPRAAHGARTRSPRSAMAHGYAMITGRPQVVMVHVIVGAANALGGIINAARAHAPILFTAGRTPITEERLPGARNRHIHWAQESFDQGAMVREFVKWDYELRNFAQLETVVDRALAISRSRAAGARVPDAAPRGARRAAWTTSSTPIRRGWAPPAATVADPAADRSAPRASWPPARNPIVIGKSAGPRPRRGAGPGRARGGARRARLRAVGHTT